MKRSEKKGRKGKSVKVVKAVEKKERGHRSTNKAKGPMTSEQRSVAARKAWVTIRANRKAEVEKKTAKAEF